MTSRNRCASKQFLTERRVRSSRFGTSVRARTRVKELHSKHRKRLPALNSRSSSNLLLIDDNRPIRDASSDALSRSSGDSKRHRLNVPRDQHDSKHRANVLLHHSSNDNNDRRCARILVRSKALSRSSNQGSSSHRFARTLVL